MAQVFYDAYGNPIINPLANNQQNQQQPPDVPRGNLQVNQGQNPSQIVPQPQQSPGSGGSGANPAATAMGTGASNINDAIRMLMQHYQNQQTAGAVQPVNPNAQVGPPTPAPNAATGVNVNQVATPASGGSGPSSSQINSAMGLISSAGHAGDALKNIGSWHDIPSAIPSPDQFMAQEQRQEQQYDFSRQRIV